MAIPVELVYAETKISMEEYLKKNSDDDLSYTILRPSTVHGPSPRMRFDLAINGMTYGAFQDGKLPLIDWMILREN